MSAGREFQRPSKGVEGFVGQEEDFVGGPGLDQEPVKMDESGGDMLPGLGSGGKPGSGVLQILEPVQGFSPYPR